LFFYYFFTIPWATTKALVTEGTITGRYNGTQISTIDNSVNQDGTSSWNGKFMQMTNKGEMIVATGSGTGDPANSKGIVKIRGEGKMWTQSTRLAGFFSDVGPMGYILNLPYMANNSNSCHTPAPPNRRILDVLSPDPAL
jgi:hypothetical protein